MSVEPAVHIGHVFGLQILHLQIADLRLDDLLDNALVFAGGFFLQLIGVVGDEAIKDTADIGSKLGATSFSLLVGLLGCRIITAMKPSLIAGSKDRGGHV